MMLQLPGWISATPSLAVPSHTSPVGFLTLAVNPLNNQPRDEPESEGT